MNAKKSLILVAALFACMIQASACRPGVSTTISSPPASITEAPQTPVTMPGGFIAFTKYAYVTMRFAGPDAFDRKYKNSAFQISGRITGIDKRIGYLIVDDGSVPPGLPYDSKWQCFFSTDLDLEPNILQIMDLKIGQSLTLEGNWGLMAVGSAPADPVYLSNCNITAI